MLGLKSVTPYDSLQIVLQTSNVQPASAVNVDKTQSDNLKRHDFFLELKARLAKEIYVREPEDIGKAFDKNGYKIVRAAPASVGKIITNVSGALGCICAFPIYEMAMRSIRSERPILPTDIQHFAIRVAMGLVYQYQDHIPILTQSSCDALIQHFVDLTIYYVFSRLSRHYAGPDFVSSSIYKMLMHRIIHFYPSDTPLQTTDDFTFTVRHLLSTGFYSLSGREYYPTTNFPNDIE